MPHVSLLRIRALLLGALCFSGCYCTSIAYPPLRGDLARATQIVPLPPQYFRWWHQVERCSGVKKSMRVTFWVIPKDFFRADTGMYARAFWGLYVRDTVLGGVQVRERIYLAAPWALTDWLVKHEMLHAMVGKDSTGDWHPVEFFRDKCRLLPEQHITGYRYPPIRPPLDSIPEHLIPRIPEHP